jgi:hypothetical protein
MTNPWIEYVKKVKRETGQSYKDSMITASKTYQRGGDVVSWVDQLLDFIDQPAQMEDMVLDVSEVHLYVNGSMIMYIYKDDTDPDYRKWLLDGDELTVEDLRNMDKPQTIYLIYNLQLDEEPEDDLSQPVFEELQGYNLWVEELYYEPEAMSYGGAPDPQIICHVTLEAD